MIAAEDQETYLWRRRHEIMHRLKVSVLYHRMRERFFNIASVTANLIAVIGITISLLMSAKIGNISALALSALSFAVLYTSFSISSKAHQHDKLATRFQLLLTDMAAKGERDFTEDDVNSWDAELHRIELGESLPLKTLVRICQNRIRQAGEQQSGYVPLWKRWTAQIFDHGK